MSYLPGGTFDMGTDSSGLSVLQRRFPDLPADFFRDETPRHPVTLQPFFLDRTEVTNEQFLAFLTTHAEWRAESIPARYHNGAYLQPWKSGQFPPGQGDLPVTFVSWYAAAAYCEAVGKRLPLEAEWEFAAGGGTARREYPWGNEAPDSSRANWGGANIGAPTPVGTYRQGPDSLADLAGNVWEYMQDPWSDDYRLAAPLQQAPLRLDTLDRVTGRRVIRGGSFEGGEVNLRSRYRDSHPAVGAGKHVGLRCARTTSP
jgi:formylglycine-generating enzyme required for sulfatase activity